MRIIQPIHGSGKDCNIAAHNNHALYTAIKTAILRRITHHFGVRASRAKFSKSCINQCSRCHKTGTNENIPETHSGNVLCRPAYEIRNIQYMRRRPAHHENRSCATPGIFAGTVFMNMNPGSRVSNRWIMYMGRHSGFSDARVMQIRFAKRAGHKNSPTQCLRSYRRCRAWI